MTSTACTERLNQMLNNVPPARYTPPSPYPKYTQYQLDMRRKAEILKYNNSSTKTNNPTKKQQFAYIVSRASNGGGAAASLSQQCAASDQGASTPLPSYFSGVPGPVTMLFNDPSIPLYRYSSAKPTLSAQEGEPTSQSTTTT